MGRRAVGSSRSTKIPYIKDVEEARTSQAFGKTERQIRWTF